MKFVLYFGGCGLSGLVVAHFAKETVLSDCLPSIIRNLEYSISLNPLIKTKTRAILLDWLIVESNHEMIPQTESTTSSFHSSFEREREREREREKTRNVENESEKMILLLSFDIGFIFERIFV
jgi:hypothetical protein